MSGTKDEKPPDGPEARWSVPESGWLDEPDEFDPDSLGPDVPSPPEPGTNSEIITLFWKLVLVFNVALLGLSVGVMFIVFDGRWGLGLDLILVGAVLFAYGAFRYHRFRVTEDDAPTVEEVDRSQTGDDHVPEDND